MKPCSILIVALVAVASAFEATADVVIVQQVEQKAPVPLDAEMTIKVQEDKVRVDIGDQVSTILDGQDQGMVSLMHSQKMAMRIPQAAMDAMKERANAQGGENDTSGVPDLEPTGNKDTINGFAVEEYKGKIRGMDVTYWVTKDLDNKSAIFEQLSKLSGDADPFRGIFKDADAFPGFPIKTIMQSPDLGESSMTVLSISEEEIPTEDFDVPADYKTMDMPAMQ